MIKNVIEVSILLVGGLATLSGIVLNWRNRKLSDTKLSSEISLDKATESKIVRDAAHSVEQDYLNRIADFRIDVDRLTRELNNERARADGWRDRLTMLEDFFFSKHMPWDRRMCLIAREHDWEIDDPPSVMDYLREVQRRIEAAGKIPGGPTPVDAGENPQ
jgi:hypothetical protein